MIPDDMMYFPLEKDGFIRDFLAAPLTSKGYISPTADSRHFSDQLAYEAYLRQEIGRQSTGVREKEADGLPFSYFSTGHDYFVDESDFYSTPVQNTLWLKTGIYSPVKQTVSAVLWTYQNVLVWCGGSLLLQVTDSRYKPIGRYPFSLPLAEGYNEVLIYMTGLGVRDSRDILGLQLPAAPDLRLGLQGLPVAELRRKKEMLFQINCRENLFSLPAGDKNGLFVTYSGQTLSLANHSRTWELPAPATEAEFYWTDENDQVLLRRKLEAISQIRPRYIAGGADAVYRLIAEKKRQPRATGIFFSVYHVLARYYFGKQTAEDLQLLREDLKLIRQRVDCSDFLIIGFLRLMKKYSLPQDLLDEIKESFLDFRYFMDEAGQDGMCFFSENHSLMFYAIQMMIGEMYPNDIFRCSGRTGTLQAQIGAARCRLWLADVAENGTEEFNSAGYLSVTLAALLLLVDFAPKDIAALAQSITDQLLQQAATHVFDGSVISPQGRVYRDVLYPYRQTVQGLLCLIFPELPYSDRECMWNICFATSAYRFPADLRSLAQTPVSKTYFSGNAEVTLHKTEHYILTSVQSPASAGRRSQPADSEQEAVKLLNEKFHGTTNFRPGVYGYQQHFWYAALSKEALLFINHPSGAADFTGMRPGYWYGNGIMPMTMQRQNRLGVIYQIPDDYPVTFTHIYLPAVKFDEVRREGLWTFAFFGQGAIALWSSVLPEPFDDALTDCELRCYGKQTAFYIICESVVSEQREEFIKSCLTAPPHWDDSQLLLSDHSQIEMRYKAYPDDTQYV